MSESLVDRIRKLTPVPDNHGFEYNSGFDAGTEAATKVVSTVNAVLIEKDTRIAELEAMLNSVSQQADELIGDIEQLQYALSTARKAMAACASAAGRDWLQAQLALSEALNSDNGTSNIDAVLQTYESLQE